MVTITEDAITTTTWSTFLTLLKGVTSTTITGGSTITVKNYSSAFPDEVFENKTNYPIFVLNTPEFDAAPVTYRNHEYSGRIELEILTNQAESADKFKDLCLKVIRDNIDDLRSDGIDEVEIDDTASDSYDRNKMKVHSRKLVWRFKVYF